jgi:N-acetyl-beta-hexosaminidase
MLPIPCRLTVLLTASAKSVNFWDTLYWGGFDSAGDWAQKGYDVVITSPDYLYLARLLTHPAMPACCQYRAG